FFFFSSRRRHTRSTRDWSSDVCSSDLGFPFVSRTRTRTRRIRFRQFPARYSVESPVLSGATAKRERQIQLGSSCIYSLAIGSFSDRKSTRLNSSHEWISYAVFCLNKKI